MYKNLFTKEESDLAVEKLLLQYKEYMNLYVKKSTFEILYTHSLSDQAREKIIDLDYKMQILGDDMKFDNPYIWMLYKYYAYQKDPVKKVKTISDLREHCATKTDICYKRLDYFVSILQKKYNINFFDDDIVDGNIDLKIFIDQHSYITELSQNEEFLQSWLNYEYNKDHN